MGTDTLTPPNEDQDRIQQHYDEEFSALTSPEHLVKEPSSDDETFKALTSDEHQAKSGVSGNIGKSEREALSSGDAGTKGAIAGAGVSAALGNTKFGRAAKLGKFFFGTARRRNTTIAGGGIAGTIIGIIIAIIMFLLPLKVVNMVTNLQNHFFASSEQATGDMTEYLMQHYIVQKVMPGMVKSKCSSSYKSKSCAVVSDSNTIVGQMFNAWRDTNLEQKLYKEHGIEIVRAGNSFYFRSDNLQQRVFLGELSAADAGDVKKTSVFENKVFTQMSRADIRNEVRLATKDATLWKRVMHRYKVGKLLENKYGVKRCVVACAARDRAAEYYAGKSTAAKSKVFSSVLAQRVVGPRAEMLSLAFDCAFSGFDCTNSTPNDVDEDGRHQTQFDSDVQAKLTEFRATMMPDDLDEMLRNSQEIRDKGITYYLLKKLTTETFAEITKKSLPVIGWIDAGATIQTGLQNAAPAIKKINYTLYSTTAISTYMIYRSNADEIKTGKVDITAVGSIAKSLDADPKTDNGGLSAEQTPLHRILNGDNSNGVASLINPKAYADSATSNTQEKCNDGSLLTATSCPEMIVGLHGALGGGAKVLDAYTNSPLSYVSGLGAKFWTNTAGKVLHLVGNLAADAATFLLEQTHVYGWIIDQANDIIKSIAKAAMDYVFPSPLGDNPSGGRSYETAAAGADFANVQYAQYGQGGHVLTSVQAAAIQNQQIADENTDFNSRNMFARMISTDSPKSMVSQLAMAMPNSLSSAPSTTLASLFSIPMKLVGIGLSPFMGEQQVSAASTTSEDPFGIAQYGHTADDLQQIKDAGGPEKYLEKNCKNMDQVNKDWGKQAVESSDTGQFENMTSNNCMWLTNTAQVAGTTSNTSLNPDYSEDGSASNVCTGTATPGTTAGTTGTVPSWVELPTVNAPIGGPVNGTISAAAANIRSEDTFAKNLGTIRNNNPDFIALNEVSTESLPHMEQSAPGYSAYRDNTIDPTSGNRNDLGNAVMWRNDTWNRLDSGRVKITNHDYTVFNGNNVDWNRYAMWGVFQRKSDGAIVSFIASHMMTNPAKFPRQWRATDPPMTRIEQYADSMHNMKALIGVLAQHGPVIMGGDMNSHPDQGNWTAVSQMQQAGYGYSDDEEVIYVFNPQRTKVVQNKVVQLDLHGDHDNKSLQTKINMNGAGPGPAIDVTQAGCDTAGGGTNRNTPPVVTDSSSVDGLINFRDASTGNGRLKPGVLFRSAQLEGISPKGEDQLSKILGNTGTIIDVREPAQRDSAPDPSISGSKQISIPIEGILEQAPMVTDPARRTQIAKALQAAAKADGPVLLHCVAGKDRTGWLVAMIMYNAGATDSQVMAEYMASSKAFPDGVKEAWLNSGLNAAKKQYGSIHGYLTKGLGLSDGDLQKLNQKFKAQS